MLITNEDITVEYKQYGLTKDELDEYMALSLTQIDQKMFALSKIRELKTVSYLPVEMQPDGSTS